MSMSNSWPIESEGLSDCLKNSWDSNAQKWLQAVRESRIPSRLSGTDQAIIDEVCHLKPKKVIDIGCGEGWLIRRLTTELNCDATGVDGSSLLINEAIKMHTDGNYIVVDYDEFVKDPKILSGPYDVAICNFSLFDEDLLPTLIAIKHNLTSVGTLLIQTLHPWMSCNDDPYIDSWRQEDFYTFANENWEPMPWYFRTLASWYETLESVGFREIVCREPIEPVTKKPLSILFRCA